MRRQVSIRVRRQLGLFHPRLRLPEWRELSEAHRGEVTELLAQLLMQAQEQGMRRRDGTTRKNDE
jgi:hypothetical protein